MLESFLIGWVIFTIVMGCFFGLMVFFRVEGVKGALLGLLVSILLGAAMSGLITLDGYLKSEKWNNGNCPNCNIHWTPYGASERNLGVKHKYYYCEECYKEIMI